MLESQTAGYDSIVFKVGTGSLSLGLQSVVAVDVGEGSLSEDSEVTTASQFFNDFVDDSCRRKESPKHGPLTLKYIRHTFKQGFFK